MAASRRKKKQRKEKFEKALTAVLCGIVAVLASGADVHADVFKAAHHGSSTSNTQAFLDAVRPQAVVVSCGAGNSYGHPHSEALAAFANVGAQVYRTDTEGTIIAYVDKAGVLQMAVSRQEAA